MTKTVQSGFAQAKQWQITWKNSERWSNPVMGWTSTADPLSNLKVNAA
jgi:NADH dehydrogenase (ubiquinone) Fe-S protein 4